jgi:hypothetical protein
VVHQVPSAEAPYAPYLRFAPRGNAPRLDWLLVTSRALEPAFAPLVRHRRETGLAADVVAVEDVRADALLGGGDLPERLRNLVRRLHARYHLRFLLLGADSDLLPSRMLPFPIKGEKVHYGEPYASDAYFGCLEGEWNRDGDARFGEAEPGDDDAPDLEPDVYVGRVPVETPQETETWVRKLLLYERPTHLDYQDRVLYLGGNVFQEGDADRFYHELHKRFFGPHGFQPTWFTRVDAGSRQADVMKALSEGVGVVCHYHHSFTYNLSLPHGAINTGNVGEITDAERPFVMFSNGCYSNQFTKEGISEKLLLSPVGGPVAFIGSTNTCFTSSLALEHAFWDVIFGRPGTTLGAGLARVRAGVKEEVGVMGFLRLSFNLLGDPATRLWPGRPRRPKVRVTREAHGVLQVALSAKAGAGVVATCTQEGPWGAWREPVPVPEGKQACVLPAVIGNGTPLSVTVLGRGLVPVTTEVEDPVRVHVKDVRVEDVHGGGRAVHVDLDGADDLVVPVPADLAPGPWLLKREVAGLPLALALPVLDGRDVGFARGAETWHFPGLARLGAPRPKGLPLLVTGPAQVVRSGEAGSPPADLAVHVEATEKGVRLGWQGAPGARWLVERETPGGRRMLTPVPLHNPVFELGDLPPLSKVVLHLSRLGGSGSTRVEAQTTFPFQKGFPQLIGANITSVQLLDLDGKRGKEVLFGDDAKGLWALHADGSEVRHAGDSWTFGLFAAIPDGVFEPVLADLVGSRAPELVATGKLKDRKLYAFRRDGRPLKGFPVSFRSRLMTPPLVGDFDGKRGKEILVVSGFGKTIELVHPDGRKEPYATVGPYNYGYPIAVNLDRDRALEVVLLDGAGDLWALDQGGKPMKGFPVKLGGPGRATPVVADLDRDRGLEIVALARGSTRLAVVDARTGKLQADLAIPDAGKPDNYAFFYPGLAHLAPKGPPSIVVGTPSKKLFAFDLVDGKTLKVRPGFPVELPAQARGVAAVDVDGDGRDELFLSLHDGAVWGLRADGTPLDGFPLQTHADTYGVPLLEDLDGDGDLELILGAADGVLRAWDLPYRTPRKRPTWPGLQGGSGMPGVLRD